MHTYNTVIVVDFAAETVTEVSEGSVFLLCVAIVNGTLERSADVMLETSDNTATGMTIDYSSSRFKYVTA